MAIALVKVPLQFLEINLSINSSAIKKGLYYGIQTTRT